MNGLLVDDGSWRHALDGDGVGRAIYSRHYSARRYQDGRRRRLFVGPGEKTVLVAHDGRALFVWRRFQDDSGQTGVNCAAFRNEGAGLSSSLITEAVRRPILSTVPPGGVVLDPFAGTGTVAEVANDHMRRSVLIELDPASNRAHPHPDAASADHRRGAGMSIATSREERERAIARLETLSVSELERDLVHWSLASHESAAQYLEFAERQAAVKDLHVEEQAWIQLLSDELVKRRRGGP